MNPNYRTLAYVITIITCIATCTVRSVPKMLLYYTVSYYLTHKDSCIRFVLQELNDNITYGPSITELAAKQCKLQLITGTNPSAISSHK